MKRKDNQTSTITIEELRAVCDVSQRFRRPVEIDWVNRTIRVLSPVLTHQTKVLSTGPLKYQDILVEIRAD